MERQSNKLQEQAQKGHGVVHTYARNILGVGLLALSQGIVFSEDQHPTETSPYSSDTQIVDVPSQVIMPEMGMPDIPAPDIKRACKSHAILYADGLSGSENGHNDRAFFRPVAKTADALNVSYETVFPKDRLNPEKNEWSMNFRKQIEEASGENKQITLMGYSMGAREILVLVASLIDPTKDTYNPQLLEKVSGLIFIGTRDNVGKHAKNHPKLSNYDEFYTDKPDDSNLPSNISPQQIDLIKKEFEGRMYVFGQPGDKITPEKQGKNLSEQLGAKYISVSAVDNNGQADNHFTLEQAGVPVSEVLEILIKKENERLLTLDRTECIR